MPDGAGLTPDERAVLVRGLGECGGPARGSDLLARAIGFEGMQDLRSSAVRVADVLRKGGDLPRHDAQRWLSAVELVFVSDRFGSGVEWETTTGFEDAETVAVLRSLQRRYASYG